MGLFDPYVIMRSIAERGLKNQARREGDYIGEDGLLVCGKCGCKRQKYIDLYDHPEEGRDEKLLVAVMCRCEEEEALKKKKAKENEEDMEQVRKLRDISLMDEKFKNASFDQMKVNEFNAKNIKICRRYVSKFDVMVEKNQGLLFWGTVGTGKSFAAACIANSLLSRKIPVIMTSFVELLRSIESNRDKEQEIISKINRAKLLILDDLGTERETSYALEKVYGIVDSRYRKQLPILITTNLTIEEMKNEPDRRYGRIYDRIFETCYPMQFAGKSWRRVEGSKRYEDMSHLLED